MEKKKIKWVHPKLIVLVRSEPGEARVLSVCKNISGAAHPMLQNYVCDWTPAGGAGCAACVSVDVS